MLWDVMGGVARRAWARSRNALTTSMEYNDLMSETDHITLPYIADDKIMKKKL